jgi:hypothetical protein
MDWEEAYAQTKIDADVKPTVNADVKPIINVDGKASSEKTQRCIHTCNTAGEDASKCVSELKTGRPGSFKGHVQNIGIHGACTPNCPGYPAVKAKLEASRATRDVTVILPDISWTSSKAFFNLPERCINVSGDDTMAKEIGDLYEKFIKGDTHDWLSEQYVASSAGKTREFTRVYDWVRFRIFKAKIVLIRSYLQLALIKSSMLYQERLVFNFVTLSQFVKEASAMDFTGNETDDASRCNFLDPQSLLQAISRDGYMADMVIVPPFSSLCPSPVVRGAKTWEDDTRESRGISLTKWIEWLTFLAQATIVLPSVAECLHHGKKLESQVTLDALELHLHEPRIAIPRPATSLVLPTPILTAAGESLDLDPGIYRCDFTSEFSTRGVPVTDRQSYDKVFDNPSKETLILSRNRWQAWCRQDIAPAVLKAGYFSVFLGSTAKNGVWKVTRVVFVQPNGKLHTDFKIPPLGSIG